MLDCCPWQLMCGIFQSVMRNVNSDPCLAVVWTYLFFTCLPSHMYVVLIQSPRGVLHNLVGINGGQQLWWWSVNWRYYNIAVHADGFYSLTHHVRFWVCNQPWFFGTLTTIIQIWTLNSYYTKLAFTWEVAALIMRSHQSLYRFISCELSELFLVYLY